MDKESLIGEIIEVEKKMFLAVNTEEDCTCQDNVEGFTFHRKVQFISWDEISLSQYLNHIIKSWEKGINLMTIKYARMEGQIDPYSTNSLIPKIVEQRLIWQQEMIQKYPKFMAQGRPLTEDNPEQNIRSFVTYLACELETYSDETLESLEKHQQKHRENGINLSFVSYDYMVKTLGYENLEHTEKTIK
jgi:hypothetical protein